MLSLGFCVFAFVAAYLAGRWSLVHGTAVVIAVGYGFGIARANLLDAASYFLFDAAVGGLYVAVATHLMTPAATLRFRSMRPWIMLLIGWPLLMLVVPMQDYLIQLVGFRGNVFLLPFILIGTQLTPAAVVQLATFLAILNVGAFGLACVEYQVGIEPFFPPSPVTNLMYQSKDVAGFTAYRIPASFSSAHAYGGTMARTLPWLLAGWMAPGQALWRKGLLAAGIITAVFGVFMSSTRVSAGIMFAILAAFSLSPEVRGWLRLSWIGLFAGIVYVASNEERLQRFTEMGDLELVSDRVSISVNMSFFDLLQNYPMGNGLGGGGTSIPAFLQSRFVNPVGMESEYARILLEQGVIGLLIWLGFIVWLVGRSIANGSVIRSLFPRLLAVANLFDWLLALIGIGMLTSIPSTVLTMLCIGYLGRDMVPVRAARPLAGVNA